VTGNDSNAIAFAFVQELAAELSKGRIDLPSVPDVAIRVRMVLADTDSTIDQVVRVTNSEPVLAATLLRMANSVAFNTSGKQVTDLRTAINRMGYNMVRSAAISFTIAQLRRSLQFMSIRPKLEEIWQHGTHVAAIAFALAKRCTGRNADEALLTGLLHNIGKLYILTRMVNHAELFSDPETEQAIMRDWHAHIGASILENWQLPEEVCEAVRDHEDTYRTHRGAADLTDIVTAAVILSQVAAKPEQLTPAVHELRAFRVLGLDAEKSRLVISEMNEEIEALRQTLGSH
jgi:putative nucleotidyltransferase with HDIG domain